MKTSTNKNMSGGRMLAVFITAMLAMVCILGVAAVYEENTGASAVVPPGDRIIFDLPAGVTIASSGTAPGTLAGAVFTYTDVQTAAIVFTLSDACSVVDVAGLEDGALALITVSDKTLTVANGIDFTGTTGSATATVVLYKNVTPTDGELGGITVGNREILNLNGLYTVSANKTFKVVSGGVLATGEGNNVLVTVDGTVEMEAAESTSIDSEVVFTLSKGATVTYTDENDKRTDIALDSDFGGMVGFRVNLGNAEVGVEITGGTLNIDGFVTASSKFDVGEGAVVNINSGIFEIDPYTWDPTDPDTAMNHCVAGTVNVFGHIKSVESTMGDIVLTGTIDLTGILNVGKAGIDNAAAIYDAAIVFSESGKGVFNAEVGATLAGTVAGLEFGDYTDDGSNDTSSVVTEVFSVTNVEGDPEATSDALTVDHSEIKGAIVDREVMGATDKEATVTINGNNTVSDSFKIGDKFTFTVKGDISIASDATLNFGNGAKLFVEGGNIFNNNYRGITLNTPIYYSELWVKAGSVESVCDLSNVFMLSNINAACYAVKVNDADIYIYTTLTDALEANTSPGSVVKVYGEVTSVAATVHGSLQLAPGSLLTADLTLEEGAEMMMSPRIDAWTTGSSYVGNIVLDENATIWASFMGGYAVHIDGTVTYGENTLKFDDTNIRIKDLGNSLEIKAVPGASGVPDHIEISPHYDRGAFTLSSGSIIANGYFILEADIFSLDAADTAFHLETGTVVVGTLALKGGMFTLGLESNDNSSISVEVKESFTLDGGVLGIYANTDPTGIPITSLEGYLATTFRITVDGVNTTDYMVQYAKAGSNTPMRLTEPNIRGIQFEGWYNAIAGGQLISATTTNNVGDLPTVYGYAKTVYYVTLTDTPGVEYFIDGVVREGEIALLPGDHTFEAKSEPYYGFFSPSVTANGDVAVKDDDVANGMKFIMNVSGNGSIAVSGCTPETYTVTYDANGGSGSMSDGTVTYPVPFPIPGNGFTAPAGKHFVGWSYDSDGATISGPTIEKWEDFELFAIWADNTYTVTLGQNVTAKVGGVDVTSGTTTVYVTDDIVLTIASGYVVDAHTNATLKSGTTYNADGEGDIVFTAKAIPAPGGGGSGGSSGGGSGGSSGGSSGGGSGSNTRTLSDGSTESTDTKTTTAADGTKTEEKSVTTTSKDKSTVIMENTEVVTDKSGNKSEKTYIVAEDKNTGVKVEASEKDTSAGTDAVVRITIPAKVVSEDGLAVVETDAVEKAIGLIEKVLKTLKDDVKPIVTVVPIIGDDESEASTVEISAEAAKKLADDAKAEVVVDMGMGAITLDNDALGATASKAAAGSALKLDLGVADKSALTQAQRDYVGDGTVYDIDLIVGDTKVHDLGGKAEISLSYTLKDGESADDVKVFYLNENGEIEEIECTYDPVTKTATFVTDHLSLYAVSAAPVDAEIPAGAPADNTMLYVAIGAIVAIAAVVGAVYFLRSGRSGTGKAGRE